MKLKTILFGFLLLLFTGVYAQDVPLGMQYQAVARDLQGNIIANQKVTLKISLVSNSNSHAVYYSEIHQPTTNQLGLFTLVIGAGEVEKGQFSKVPWSTEDVWMQIAIKDKGKTDFATISNSKLLAVPYAFHALTASQLAGSTKGSYAAKNTPGVPSQNWSLFGNSTSNPDDPDLKKRDKLGTTDYVDLVLVTNNLERLRIKADGDIDIARSLKVGANLNVDSSANLNRVSGSTTNFGPFTVERQSPTLLTGTLTVNQATDLKSTLNVDGITDLNSNLNVNNASPTVLTGTLRVDGITDLNNNLNVNNESPTLLTGILQVDKDAVFKEHVLLDNPAYNSTSISTGALVVNGGFGLGQNLFVGGDANFGGHTTFQGAVNITDETQSTSTTTGALIIGGGTGIGKNLNVGGTSGLNGQVTINANLSGSDGDYNAYPFRVQGASQGVAIKINGSRSTANNFVTFWDATGNQGRIEGQTLGELHNNDDYKSQLTGYEYDVASAAIDATFGGIDIAFAAADVAAAASSTTPCVGLGACETAPIVSLIAAAAAKLAVTVGEEAATAANVGMAATNLQDFKSSQDAQVGVSYQSGAGDYAEYLMRSDVNESMNAGDIISVSGGKITKNTNNTGKMMVISTSPIVLGNLPQPQNEKNYEKVAFMGQVPVKVFGKVNIGDYIIPNGVNNGVGKAVSPENIKTDEIKNIVGVAWSSATEDLKLNMINVAVGLNTNDNSEKVQSLEKVVNQQTSEISNLKKQIAETNTLLAKLVPGFKSDLAAGNELGADENKAIAENTVQPIIPSMMSPVKSFKVHLISREEVLQGLEGARQLMKIKGINMDENFFWKKIENDPTYKEQVVQMIQKKVDDTAKSLKN